MLDPLENRDIRSLVSLKKSADIEVKRPVEMALGEFFYRAADPSGSTVRSKRR
jgi:hypothetical protein